MRLSQAGFESVKIKDLDNMYPAQDILMKTNQIMQYSSGIYGYNNVVLRARQNLEKIVRDVLDQFGCTEVLLPMLQPKEFWEKSGRWDVYIDDGTMMEVKTDKNEYGLGPTAEEMVTELVRNKVRSYKSLPFVYYQIGEKFRNEIRNRGYLLRGKSFPMMDAYSFDKTYEDLEKSYVNIRNAYIEIFKRLGLEVVPVAADGGAIGKGKSEEFMVISDFGEDTIFYDEKTKKGFNIEVTEKENYKEFLKTEYGIENIDNLKEKKAIEVGHIFQLGTQYSESMEAKYVDSDGIEKPFFMGCYGIGISRTLAVIYEKSIINDFKNNPNGIALTENIAPYLIQFIPKLDDESKVKEVEEIYKELKKYGVNSIIDDRKNKTIGEKIKDVRILGTPYIAILGDKVETGYIEVENLKTGKSVLLKQDELIQKLIYINNKVILGDVDGVISIV